jgi:signal transduction histidine kinase/putative methionine-R-sulfoxide reductase with GAF domain
VKPKAKAKLPFAPKPPKNQGSGVRDLEKRLTEALKREAEALEQQTAAAEILRVISNSPTDVQPVLDAMAESAARLCASYDASIFLVDGDVLRLVAHHGPLGIRSSLVIPAIRGTVTGRSVLDRETIRVADLQAATDEFPEGSRFAHELGFRTYASVPLLRDGIALGAIGLRRTEIQPFTDKQIVLLQTFADQAVIAIENVRLFNETKEALEQQTATSEILRVISSSPTDVQPVFDVIVERAVRLCGARFGRVYRYDGGVIHMVAGYGLGAAGLSEVQRVFPRPASDDTIVGRVILTRQPALIRDIEREERVPALSRRMIEALETRSQVTIPMLRTREPIGAITLGWAEPDAFDEQQTALLKTFADQAVIAIENVRLFKELEARNRDLTEALDQQTATAEILRVISSSPTDLQPVLDTIAGNAARVCGAYDATVLLREGNRLRRVAHHGPILSPIGEVRALNRDSVAGRAILQLEPVHIHDVLAPTLSDLPYTREAAHLLGFRTILAVPLLREGEATGSLTIRWQDAQPFSSKQVALLQSFADQAVIAIENVRLFKELEAANRGLEAASRHKSEFLANMSHELRTPLNAVIGFSEVLLQRMFGELNDKQDEYLKDIYASGQHLLSLINDILDLSKIEAGRMELAPTPFHLPTALENAVTLVKERASRRGIALQLDIDPRLGELVGDERKVKQVLLNLLSNAVKFTPEGGRISLRASRTDGMVEIAVTDTGIGIAPKDQAAVFEEFRQVGSDETRKQEGTGLGLTLAKKFVELHGGRIWVESELGRGATFTFTLPVS